MSEKDNLLDFFKESKEKTYEGVDQRPKRKLIGEKQLDEKVSGKGIYKPIVVPFRVSKDKVIPSVFSTSEDKAVVYIDVADAGKYNKKRFAKQASEVYSSIFAKTYANEIKEGKRINLDFVVSGDYGLNDLIKSKISKKADKKGKKKFEKGVKKLKKNRKYKRKSSSELELAYLDEDYQSWTPDAGRSAFKKGGKSFAKGALKGVVTGAAIGAILRIASEFASYYASLNAGVDEVSYANAGLLNSAAAEIDNSRTFIGEIKAFLDPLKAQVDTFYASVGDAVTNIGDAILNLEAVQTGLDGLKDLGTSMGLDVDAIESNLTTGFEKVTELFGYSTDLNDLANTLESQGTSEMSKATESFTGSYLSESYDLGILDADSAGGLDLFQSGDQSAADLIYRLVEEESLTSQEAKLIADSFEQRTFLYQAGQQKIAAAGSIRTISTNIYNSTETLENTLTSIQTSNVNLGDSLATMDSTIDSLETNITDASSYLDTGKTTLEDVKSGLDGVGASLDSADAKLNSIETALNTVYSGGVIENAEGYLPAVLANEVNTQVQFRDVVGAAGNGLKIALKLGVVLGVSYVLGPIVTGGIFGAVNGTTNYVAENKRNKELDGTPMISPEIALYRSNISYKNK